MGHPYVSGSKISISPVFIMGKDGVELVSAKSEPLGRQTDGNMSADVLR